VKYWDTSALVPLIIDQESSDVVEKIADSDSDKSFWWGARVECSSALARLERESVPQKKISRAFQDLEEIFTAGSEIQPSEPLRDTAIRFLRVHPPRATPPPWNSSAWMPGLPWLPRRKAFGFFPRSHSRPAAPATKMLWDRPFADGITHATMESDVIKPPA
jgi:hypothetical protein